MDRYDEIKCRDCDGTGGFQNGNDPFGCFTCAECEGSGVETVRNWDVESLLSAGCEMTYEEAVARWMEENGDYFEDADGLARAYGLKPTPVFHDAAE